MEVIGRISMKKNKKRFILNNFQQSILTNRVFYLIITFDLFFIIAFANANQNLFISKKENHHNLGVNHLSEITIISKGFSGNRLIINCDFYSLPDEIFLNDTKIAEKQCRIYLNNQNSNKIKMRWFENLKSCKFMFYSYSSTMANIVDIDFSNFDTSFVTDMSYMFYNRYPLNSLNVSSFNTSSVTNMSYMFYYCNFLSSLNFNTSLVRDMSNMFGGLIKIKYLNLSNFDTSSVEYMSKMFIYDYELEILDISKFNTSSVIDMSYMFYDCYSLSTVNLSSFNTSKVLDMSCMFYGFRVLESLNLSNFNTASVTSMRGMFSSSSKLKYLDISNFNTSQVKEMQDMFSGCLLIININLSNFRTKSLNNMEYMFAGCYSLKYLNISNFDTSSVTMMNFMFSNCISLESLNLSHFNTSSLTALGGMFYNCNSLKFLDIHHFNTSSFSHMHEMFEKCYSLSSINISNFDTSSVIDMERMFSECYSLTSLDISNFNTSLVKNMYSMFLNCSSLKSLNLSNFDTSSVTNMEKMFYGCKNLIYINLQNFQEIQNLLIEKILDKTKENIIYCINEEKASGINEIFIHKLCSKKDCTLNWRENNQMLIKYSCSSNCDKNLYHFFYNNTCYEKCPLGTHAINDTCIDDLLETFPTELNTNINTDININNNSHLLLCSISIIKINDSIINSETIQKYINNYNLNDSSYSNVYFYINQYEKLSITIFKNWSCTNELLKYDFFELNINKIYNKIKHLNNSDYFIYIYINYKYNNYFEIYDIKDKKSVLNLEKLIGLNEYSLIIRNNFTEEINNYLSKVIIDIIQKNKIDIFDNNFYIFNDLCKNLTIQNIDIPLKERIQIFFLGNFNKEIICNDINCYIESISMNKLIGECNCKIENFINNLIIKKEQYNNIINDEYEKYINSKSKINSLLNLKCFKESFKLKNLENNANFYISIVFISFFIILFFIFYIYSKKNIFKKYTKNKLNPPKIHKFDISDDFEDNEEEKNKQAQIIIQVENKVKEITNEEKQSNDLLFDNLDEKKYKINRYKHSIKNYSKNNKLPSLNNTNSQKNKNIDNEKVIKFNNNRKKINTLNDLNQKTETNNLKIIEKDIDIVPTKIINENNKLFIINNFFKLDKNKNFLYYYWKLLSLKQPIINLFTSIEALKTGKSYIPLLIKIMRILFYLSLNIFFNSLHMEQQYFRNKFQHFEAKYKITSIFPE